MNPHTTTHPVSEPTLVLVNQVVGLSVKSLFAKQRWVVQLSFVVAALLTPTPDPMNQLLLAVPIIALYQVGVGAVWVANRSHQSDRFTDIEARAALMAHCYQAK